MVLRPAQLDTMNGHMIRTFTAPPASSHPRIHHSHSSTSIPQYNHQHDSQYSATSHISDSTQHTSASTLFPAPNPTPPITSTPGGGPVGASDNVINRVADRETSLFQVCVTLRARLAGVPGFEEQVLDVEEDLHEELDPVMLLWQTFRRGYPLLMIFNALNPKEPLSVDEARVTESRRAQVACYKFLQGCINNLKFPTEECFILQDLKASNDREINMSGFVKVVRVVNRIVELLVQKGVLESFDGGSGGLPDAGRPSAKRTQRQHIVDELVRTERTYVQHLELLQAFSKHVRQNSTITGDAIHEIFLNLDNLLEFQRRFLVRVEQTNAQNEETQNWGQVFLANAHSTAQDSKDFRVYEPYIENQKRCEEAAMREFDKLRGAGGPIEMRQMVESPTHFTSFLLKPFQRLSKYPLLLKELRDKGGLAEDKKADISRGMEAMTAVLNRTNASIDREERGEAVRALKSQVEDWKNHRVEAFGDLLLYGTHTVLKGDPSKDSEREYRMYLFEKILLCCKELNPNKPKNKIKGTAPVDKKGRPRLQLKGRIFMQNVTETSATSKPGDYKCQIHWRGDDTIEHFVIRFPTEEAMKKWSERIENQRRICQEQGKHSFSNVSETEFTYMQGQGRLENPYQEDDHQDDEDVTYASRNGSNTSLRSRSTTNESIQPPSSRSNRTVVPGMPSLTLRTQPNANTAPSPSERAGQMSYFSPGAESPVSISSRTSTSSNILPFQRQPLGQSIMHRDEPNRYTAPAMERGSVGRDAHSSYQQDGRTVASAPYAGYPYSASQAFRNRSASNPDMQNVRRVGTAPPVPSVPPHLAHSHGAINRSQTNSPMSSNNGQQGAPRVHGGYYSRYGSGYDGANRDITPLPLHHDNSMVSPALGSAASLNGELVQPSQLKVKVKVPSEGSTMTLVVPFNISYQSLKDRVDAKLQRNTSVSLSAGNVRLKYLYDDEFVSIRTDEDVQTAFETWKEQQQDDIIGQLGEIELYCHQ